MSPIMPKSVDTVNQSTAPAERAPENDVLDLIHTVMHQYRSQQYRTLRDGPHDITHMDSKVLGFFAHHPGATQSDLAAHSGRDKGQLARLIGGLKERGLLQAQADEEDRRTVRLSLTPQGRASQQALQRQGRRVANTAVAGLSAEERAQLVALLRRVRSNLERG